MQSQVELKGTWWNRFAINFFTFLFALLIYWLLGFFLEDIESIRGPSYEAIENKYVNEELLEKQQKSAQSLDQVNREIISQQEKQKNFGDSSRNLEKTMSQLLEIQKLSLQKKESTSDAEQSNFTTSLNLFLENQKAYQQLSQSINQLTDQKQKLLSEQTAIAKEIDKQKEPALKEFEKLNENHSFKLALYQLAILLPIMLIAAALLAKLKNSNYLPLAIGFAAATGLKIFTVINNYFPSKYIKYILTLSLLSLVGYLLIRFIRAKVQPKMELLLQQYREGYEKFLCPICDYPIRIGPRKFLSWTRRTVNTLAIPNEKESVEEENYICPSCGTFLFEQCTSCKKSRHSLLPNCSHCGFEKTL